ncbi:MAG: class I SAM-dependent methyltransferase [Planctomycetes bacterium]|nr:class I SAM-dependent methyltransferase [Planctomycetota bacterium]
MRMTERQCPLCGSAGNSKVYSEANFDAQRLDEFSFASRKIPEYAHYRLMLCGKCDLIYASPIPAENTLSSKYQEAEFVSADESGYASLTYGRVLASMLSKLPDLESALDIGTSDGAFLEVLVSSGFDQVEGVEPSRASIAAAKPEIRSLISEGIFDSSCYQGGKFSLITCFQTLEHLSDPQKLCRDIFGYLKSGGAGLLVCHNFRAVSSKVLGARSPIMDIEHLQLFSPVSLKIIMENAGFTNVKVKRVVNRYPLHYWTRMLPMPNTLKKYLIETSKRLRIGLVPVSLPAGNISVTGYRNS